MANYVATDTVSIHGTIEGAVAALETALEATDNGKTVQTCTIIQTPDRKYASILVVTDAVA